MKKINKNIKIFVLLTLLLSITGCEILDEILYSDDSSLQIVERQKPNLSEESDKIDIDPDSDALTEEKSSPNLSDDNSQTSLETEDFSEANTADIHSNQQNESTKSENVITYNSFGKIKIGMKITEASRALGVELIAPHGKGECYYVEPKQGFKGVDFMIIGDVIARIDIENKDYSTDKGAKIGDSEEKIKSLYQNVSVYPQKYDEKLHDLEVFSADEKYMIIFETDGKNVTRFRVGRTEEVSLVERCG